VSHRALVTGGNGFVAQWVIRAMLARGWSVTSAGVGEPPAATVLARQERDAVAWQPMDITVQDQVARVVSAARPDVVVHLAGVSYVPDATDNPTHAYEVNALGLVRLLAELRRSRAAGTSDPRLLVVGSAEQYGRHDVSEMPLTENAELRPLTVYAASKVAQEVVALQAFRNDGAHVVCTRSFNHSGQGHGKHFLLPALVERALQLSPSGGTLRIGNGDTVRDYLHVEDVADAYLALLEQGVSGEAYNVSSGEGTTVRELAQTVLRRLGRSADITTTPEFARPVDVPMLVGSSDKLRRLSGWVTRRTRDDIIDDLIHAATR
jgi:GDP-4-dehydro-6-deoxy-D-mannose reductase